MDNQQQAYQYLISQGYPPVAAAGIVGNLVQESGVNPTVNPGDSGTAHGIAQWRGDRWSGLQNYAKQNNGSANDLNTQLGYLDYELRNRYGDTYQKLMSARSPGDAAGAFALGYERPKGAETGIAANVDGWGNRLSAAQSIYGAPVSYQQTAQAQPVAPTVQPKTIEDLLRSEQMQQAVGLLGKPQQQAQLANQQNEDFARAMNDFHQRQHLASMQGLLGGQ
jgi:Phage tail lysozyme